MAGSAPTRLQIQTASLLHVQTQTRIELSYALPVIHIGKPNDQIPPDVDVSGFPDSEIVSRVHADIRVEGDTFYIEDMGSSNGTYINHTPLLPGNRHRLRSGDRIGLGKGDKVTFIFQLS
jgi:pSer/pThr/pTyr-binding forkhead associated (FHA) protein